MLTLRSIPNNLLSSCCEAFYFLLLNDRVDVYQPLSGQFMAPTARVYKRLTSPFIYTYIYVHK